LSGGTNGSQTVTPNYGYPTGTQAFPSGFFQMSPIIVGRGGGGGPGDTANGGVGCGGGGANAGFGAAGGAGMAVIISW
jgi:hypothetical protein